MTFAASPRPVRHRVETCLQAGIVSAVLALPAAAQKRLAGRPIVLDGLTLDTQVQMLLRLQRLGQVSTDTSGRSAGDAGAGRPGQGHGRRPAGRRGRSTGPSRASRHGSYVPTALAASSDPRPTLVFFHGGGFFLGGLESHDAACRLLARESGVQVIAVDYRLAPSTRSPRRTTTRSRRTPGWSSTPRTARRHRPAGGGR